MKKVLLLFLLFVPLFVNAEECSMNSISIIGVETQDDSNNSNISGSATFEENTIQLDVNMFNVGDKMLYRITLQNDSFEDYSIKNLHVNSESNYLTYEYIPEDHSDIIRAQSTKTILLMVEYENEIPVELFESGKYVDSQDVKISVSNEVPLSGESSFSSIINPLTGNAFYLILFLLIIYSFMFSLFKKKKNTNIHLLFIMVMMIPIGVKALCTYEIEISSNVNIIIPRNLYNIVTDGAVMDNINSEFVNNDTPGIDFTKTASDENGKGVYIKSDTSEDDYPIYYYRGDVKNNNIIFANKCWKAVRTTDTGGTKLIYNGEIEFEYKNDNLDQSAYDIESDIVATSRNEFSFNSSTKEWNVIVSDYDCSAIEFSLKEAGSYKLNFHFTSGTSSGGSVTYYYNDEKVEVISIGGGNPVDKEYEIDCAGESDVIKVSFYGTASNNSTIGMNISATKNDEKIDQSKYNIISNGTVFNGLVYDDENKQWQYSSPYYENKHISFHFLEPGNYLMDVPTNSGGPIYYKKNGENLSIIDGHLIDLGNVISSDTIDIDYTAYAPSPYIMTFSVGRYTKIYTDSCNNSSGSRVSIGSSPFNVNNNSLSYVGYSYGTAYTWNSSPSSSALRTWGHDVSLDSNGNYYLSDTTSSSSWDNTRHYCRNSVFSRVTYYFRKRYGINLIGGKKIEDVYNEAVINSSDQNKSSIRNFIDNWYESEISDQYGDYLEDTKWCNDRSVYNKAGWDLDGSLSEDLVFNAHYRYSYNHITSEPQLECTNPNDYLTVNNGKLTYPIALLTIDEAALAGTVYSNSNNNYLSASNSISWLLSPAIISESSRCTSTGSGYNCQDYCAVSVKHFSATGLGNAGVDTSYSVRPSISLKNDVMILDGDGTVEKPYHVYYES